MARKDPEQKFLVMNFREELPPIIQFADPDLYLTFWLSVELCESLLSLRLSFLSFCMHSIFCHNLGTQHVFVGQDACAVVGSARKEALQGQGRA